MGFVQFPGSDSEPAKSGPAAAQHLAHVYKEYLAAFDNVYVNTVMQSRQKNDAQRPMPGAPNFPIARPSGITDPSQMQLVMAYASIPVPELRRRGIPEQLIQFIEANRTTIMRQQTEAVAFRNQLTQRPDPSRGPMPVQPPPFGGPPNMNSGMIPPGPFNNMPHMQRNPMDGQPPQPPQLMRPSRETLQTAITLVTKLKNDYSPDRTFHVLS
jgi:hypothetical protein